MESVSHVVEEYLEMIYKLQERSGVARTSDLVKLLNVAPGTVTNTIERLEKESLVLHEPYRGVKLTEKGRRIALRVVRRHRLSERLLTDILKVEWENAHTVACRLEHVITDEVAKKIEKVLGHPRTCPHGNPIPTECGGIIEGNSLPLTEFEVGERGVIIKIVEEEPELLNYLNRMGLKPDVIFEVVEKAPFEGPITIRINGKTHALSRNVASLIRGWRVSEK